MLAAVESVDTSVSGFGRLPSFILGRLGASATGATMELSMMLVISAGGFFVFLGFDFLVLVLSIAAIGSSAICGRESCAMFGFLLFLSFFTLTWLESAATTPLVSTCLLLLFLPLGGSGVVPGCADVSAAEMISAMGFSGVSGLSFLLRLGLSLSCAAGSRGVAGVSVFFYNYKLC